MAKTILIFLIFILGALILFLGGYLLLTDRSSQTATISNLTRFEEKTGSPSGEQNNTVRLLRRLSNVKIVSPVISEDGKKVIYFEKDSGKVWANDFTGQDGSLLSGKITDGFLSAVWSLNGYEAVISKNTKGVEKLYYFNLKNGQFTLLHPFISRPAFSRNGQKLAYLFFDPRAETGSISISNPDGSVYTNLIPTRLSDIRLSWLNENTVSFFSGDINYQELFILNIKNNAVEKITEPASGLDVLWSPDGRYLLYSFYQTEDKQSKLKILNTADKTETDIPVFALASQCVWRFDSVSFYCDGRLTGELEGKLYLVNLKNQTIELVYEPTEIEEFSAKNPLLSPAEDFLIFINSDQYLYGLNLR